MKVLFLQSVAPHRKGDVANVAEGYAQNFLFPRKLAVRATAGTEVALQQKKSLDAARTAQVEQSVLSLLHKLNGLTVAVQVKASSSGKLYAALTPAAIAQAIEETQGMRIPQELHKQLPHLKMQGEYPVTLQYLHEKATFILKV